MQFPFMLTIGNLPLLFAREYGVNLVLHARPQQCELTLGFSLRLRQHRRGAITELRRSSELAQCPMCLARCLQLISQRRRSRMHNREYLVLLVVAERQARQKMRRPSAFLIAV